MIVWPEQLGCFLIAGYSEGSNEAVIRTDMQVGFAQARSTHSDPVWFVQGSVVIPFLYFDALVDFYEIQLKNGAKRFQMQDPINHDLAWNWRFTAPFTVTPAGSGYLNVSMSLERIPGTMFAHKAPNVYLSVNILANAGLPITIYANVSNYVSLQWQKHGANIHGETGETLVVSSPVDGEAYTLIATNKYGETTSNISTIKITKKPVLKTPIPDLVAFVGTPYTYDAGGHFTNP